MVQYLPDAMQLSFKKNTGTLCPKRSMEYYAILAWGRISYIEYRIKWNSVFEYEQIDSYCKYKIDWFVSAWDEEAVEFTEQFDLYISVICILTDFDLMQK